MTGSGWGCFASTLFAASANSRTRGGRPLVIPTQHAWFQTIEGRLMNWAVLQRTRVVLAHSIRHAILQPYPLGTDRLANDCKPPSWTIFGGDLCWSNPWPLRRLVTVRGRGWRLSQCLSWFHSETTGVDRLHPRMFALKTSAIPSFCSPPLQRSRAPRWGSVGTKKHQVERYTYWQLAETIGSDGKREIERWRESAGERETGKDWGESHYQVPPATTSALVTSVKKHLSGTH